MAHALLRRVSQSLGSIRGSGDEIEYRIKKKLYELAPVFRDLCMVIHDALN